MRRSNKEGMHEYGYEDDEDDEDGGRYIDLNSLPIDQQQYYLQGGDLMLPGGGMEVEGNEDLDEEEDCDDDEDNGPGNRGIVGRGDGVGFFAEGDADEGMSVRFNENANDLQ